MNLFCYDNFPSTNKAAKPGSLALKSNDKKSRLKTPKMK